MVANDKRLGKLLSPTRRHDPSTLGVTMDRHGWDSIASIVAVTSMTKADVERVVVESDKKRFAISEGSQFIRALTGHSIEIDLGLSPSKLK